jgi:HK97 family phage prohead protease
MVRIEVRGDNSVLIDGYVNAVDRFSRPIQSPTGAFIERIEPRAFQRALERTNNVDLLLDHNKDRKLGSISDGNLQLFEDNIGLRAICTVTDADVIEKAKKGELRGWSFGFTVNKDSWEKPEGATLQRRSVQDLNLSEVSIIDSNMMPCYIGTSIETRGNDKVITEIRAEEFKAVIEDMTKDNKIDSEKKKAFCEKLRRGIKIQERNDDKC